ncbi:MAG: iron chelate uptake ABC transporter family permease subunit [Euryarchaeota archaeon]|nr:iron chelate uptake ABC transporter family permease subunit [Euryarchaeota archaeon]
MERFWRWRVLTLALAGVLFLVIVGATAVGPVDIPPVKVAGILLAKLPAVGGLAGASWTPVEENIVLQVRLPRIILGALVGSALAVAGTAMQGLFKNPMADPYVIGISSGAALGATLAIVSGVHGGFSLPAAAFLGALAAAFLVYYIAREDGAMRMETLLLSGIAVAIFFSALASLFMYLAGEDLHRIVFWLMGGLWARGWEHVKVAALPILAGSAGIHVFARELNAMQMGEEAAVGLGIDIEEVKKVLLALSALVAGVAVSVSGIIGFVGLVIPHMVRLVVGPDHRILVPAAALVGASFLILADTAARSIISPAELPVGIITAFLGAPFFIYLLRRRRGVGPY